jgi:uncharacterized protein YxjI
MRFVMKERLFSWGDDFYIKDEDGRDLFFVDGKAFSFGNQLSFQDLNGNELAYIKQKLLSWGPTYEIYRGGELVAVVKKDLFSFFRHVFTVDVPGPNDLTAEGDFWDHEYTFSRSDRVVAQVSKKWLAWTDTYGIEVADHEDAEDAVLVLASAVVIDQVCHDKDNH